MRNPIRPRTRRSVIAIFIALFVGTFFIGMARPLQATVVPATRFDFDADRKADLAVYRPSDGTWYISNSLGGYSYVRFGLNGDVPTAADYDGDTKYDIAVFRNGVWYRLSSANGTFSAVTFGLADDQPIPADFDGDAKADIAVYRQSDGVWHILRSSDQGYSAARFGLAEDVPLPADYDGDGRSDINVFRPSEGMWYRLSSINGALSVVRFGMSGDIPVRGDFDGDSKDDVAVWRPSTGVWYIIRSASAALMAVTFGLPLDLPVPADYDGDTKTDIAVFRPSDGVWHRINSATSTYIAARFGNGTDIPVSAAKGGIPPAPAISCNWYVTTSGLPTNNGSQTSPWTLAHALSGAGGAIRPGQTVCVMGGTYPGRYFPSLNGTSSQPIVVRAYPGQRVIIDGGLQVTSLSAASVSSTPYTFASISLANTSNVQPGSTIRIGTENMRVDNVNHSTRVATVVRGWAGSCSSTGTCPSWPSGSPVRGYLSVFDVSGSYTWYWGFEITNTGHISRLESSGVADLGAGLFDQCRTGCKFINNVIHNTAGGIGSFGDPLGNEYYGNVLFYNGWDGSGSQGDPGRGHGIYIQNMSPTSPPKKVTDNISFSNFGYNMQAYTDEGGIHNLEFTGNIFFEASNPILLGPTFNMLIGGGNQGFVGAKFISNYTYNPTISGIRRGTDVVGWGDSYCTSPVIQGNYFASGNFGLSVNCSGSTVTGNTFYTTFNRASSFPNNTYFQSRPLSNSIFVRPNTYETGRGNIAVYNWTRAATVSVDLSNLGLSIGQRFQIRDAQNFNGPAVFSGTYNGGSVTIPMTNSVVAPIYGTVNKQPVHSDIEFGAFVVLPF